MSRCLAINAHGHITDSFTTNHNERQCKSHSYHPPLTISQAFTTGEPMDEDILSDVVPSNIVSRQVWLKQD
jgi:hypothetical protein